MGRPSIVGLSDNELSLIKTRACVLHYQGGVAMRVAMEQAVVEHLGYRPDGATVHDYVSALGAYMARTRRQLRIVREEPAPPTDKELANFVKRTIEEMRNREIEAAFFIACAQAKRRFHLPDSAQSIQQRVNRILAQMTARAKSPEPSDVPF